MKAALYCRLSKEDENKREESESIKNQKILLTSYAIEKDWDIYKTYVDEDYRGSDRDRPAFNEMIIEAELRKFDIIICKSQSRFARDMELIEKYLHGKFPEWGIRFISIVDRADTMDDSNKKIRQLIGLSDEWMLDTLSQDIRRVLTNKRKNGEYIGSWALYGYKKDPKNKNHLVIDPEPAEIVRTIYQKYIDGDGMQKIARVLNDMGIDNPYNYKKKQGIAFNESRMTPKAVYWNAGAIYSILTNQTYTGDLVQGRFQKVSYKSKKLIRKPEEEWNVVENTHEPIISKEIFERAKAIRAGKGRAIRDGTRHIFSKKVFCNECNQIMTSGRYSKKNNTNGEIEYIKYLKCSSRAIALESCIGASIVMHNLEAYIIEEINKLAESYFQDEEILKLTGIANDFDEKKEKALQVKAILEKRLAEHDLAIKELYFDKVKAIITEQEFSELKKSISSERLRIEKELLEKNRILESLIKSRNLGDSRKEIISKYRKIDKLTRPIIEELIEKIYVGNKNKVGGRVIQIIWNI